MNNQKERPNVLMGKTKKIETGCGRKYITLNFNDAGEPFEVFDIMGKAGGCASANSEAIARLITWGLRSGASLDEAIKHLRGIRCHEPIHNGATSCADAMAVALIEISKKDEGNVS